MIRALTFRGGRGGSGEDAVRAGVVREDRAAGARLPSWYVRLLKGVRRIGQRARTFVRWRRGVRVAGVWYKELTATPMHRALRPPPRGPGYKDYRVTFADGSKQVIRCSAGEVYADLMGSVGLGHLHTIAGMIRPGWRVLEVGSGSGYRAAWLASVVGPSGSVVALGQTREPVEYAIRRYRLPNVAFEVASPQSLSGEIDGAFDCVVVSTRIDGTAEGEGALREVWRVLSPGGLLVAREAEAEGCMGTGSVGAGEAPSAGERLLERLIAAHRVLGESGTIEMPRTIARLDEEVGDGRGVEMLAVLKPEGTGLGRERPPGGTRGDGPKHDDDEDGPEQGLSR
ncbi:MAG: methyltransferase domain-containing protein [Phycisphaeraceae bacterium]|nr:methyltransferase domain-containing protein [Phycisphaeraceae bacterium]